MEANMKAAAAIIIILALVIGIVPQFTDCHSQGKVMTMANGMTVEMKCFWTAMASIVLAGALGILGVLLGLSKRKETRQMLSVLGVGLGTGVILIPTALIGVCANPMMMCNMVLKPTLILSGSLAILTSLFVFGISQSRGEETKYDLRPTGA
jgi:hypothetical protein